MYIKGFDKDLKCRGYQFEIGKEFKIETSKELKLRSNTVFHFCDSLQKVHQFYDCNDKNNRFCEIEILGEIVKDDEKIGSNHIKVVREIVGEELNILKGLINGNAGLFNTGDWNTGDFNSCNFSSGFFCTQEPKAIIFNIETDMTVSEFRNSKYMKALNSSSFNLTEWVYYTKKEKTFDKTKELIGGYLKSYTYKEACANWWENMSKENKDIVKSMPNFDAKIFKEITGIKV